MTKLTKGKSKDVGPYGYMGFASSGPSLLIAPSS